LIIKIIDGYPIDAVINAFWGIGIRPRCKKVGEPLVVGRRPGNCQPSFLKAKIGNFEGGVCEKTFIYIF
jgi:hypothetical protein